MKEIWKKYMKTRIGVWVIGKLHVAHRLNSALLWVKDKGEKIQETQNVLVLVFQSQKVKNTVQMPCYPLKSVSLSWFWYSHILLSFIIWMYFISSDKKSVKIEYQLR